MEHENKVSKMAKGLFDLGKDQNLGHMISKKCFREIEDKIGVDF